MKGIGRHYITLLTMETLVFVTNCLNGKQIMTFLETCEQLKTDWHSTFAKTTIARKHLNVSTSKLQKLTNVFRHMEIVQDWGS